MFSADTCHHPWGFLSVLALFSWTLGTQLLVASAASNCATPAPYEAKTPPLTTNWTAQARSSPWPDYPRPLLRRENWLNLNGLWEFKPAESTDDLRNPPVGGCGFDRHILVPFPMESALSGIMQNHSLSWYRKTFSLPPSWTGGAQLNFGAVDYEATVFVNGENMGFHRGGYFKFELDISKHVRPAGEENEVLVFVYDPTDTPGQLVPIGKQALDTSHVFYTSSTGIWQTVFVEPIPNEYITEIKLNGDMNGAVTANISTSASSSTPVKVTVFSPFISRPEDPLYPPNSSAILSNHQGFANKPFTFEISSPRPWSPGSPDLYHVQIEMGEDIVYSYFGLRSVEKKKDSKGVFRTFLNGKSVFPFGTLDQGYWPDGIYTAPTRAAMEYDLKVLKQLGFNAVRKHVKIEPDLFYYACDRMGLMVWQDMPSMSAFKPEPTDAQQVEFERQLKLMVTTHLSFPCIILWVIYNEGWAQNQKSPEVRLAPELRQLDPTRLVIGASGWKYHGAGDYHDNHHYPYPQCGTPFYSQDAPPYDPTKIAVQGEFGGIGHIPGSNNLWNVPKALATINSTYELAATIPIWNYRTLKMVNELEEQTKMFNCAGGIFTQTTDVEAETNGLMTYDRRILRPDTFKWQSTIKALYEAAAERSKSDDNP